MKKLAQSVFRRPPLRLNCAQAVAHAWETRAGGLPAGLAQELEDCGGGRAPGGLCGALYAATRLAAAPAEAEKRLGDFAAAAGNIRCREIRRSGAISCGACVGLAAELLETALENGMKMKETRS